MLSNDLHFIGLTTLGAQYEKENTFRPLLPKTNNFSNITAISSLFGLGHDIVVLLDDLGVVVLDDRRHVAHPQTQVEPVNCAITKNGRIVTYKALRTTLSLSANAARSFKICVFSTAADAKISVASVIALRICKFK